MLTTGLVAMVSAGLLWLGWLLAGDVAASVPSLPDGAAVIVGGVPVAPDQLANALRDHAREQVLRAGSVAFVCVVVATGLLAWTVTGRVLRPLRDVTATAQRLSVESLGERIGHRGPRDEVAELAATFDAMLDRLQAAFDSQRHFVANASHELRTPLSVIRTELDVTLSDPNADVAELRRMADVVRTATLRAGQLVEALLLLARTDGVGVGAAEPVDLAEVVSAAWQPISSDAERRSISATFHGGSAPSVGDPALLERDPDRVAELFEPFRRGGVDRTAHTGTGLGLSIVRAVVLAHRGQVSADAVPGGGLTVTVRLPAPAITQ